MIGKRRFALVVNEQEVEALIDCNEDLRTFYMNDGNDDEAEQCRLRIEELREALRQWEKPREVRL